MLIFGSVEAAELSFFYSFYRPVWVSTERWLHLWSFISTVKKRKVDLTIDPIANVARKSKRETKKKVRENWWDVGRAYRWYENRFLPK